MPEISNGTLELVSDAERIDRLEDQVTSLTHMIAILRGEGETALLNKPLLAQPNIADFTNAQHPHGNAAGGGTIDHGALTGLADDDHPQYAVSAHAHDHGTNTGLADNDHPQYARLAVDNTFTGSRLRVSNAFPVLETEGTDAAVDAKIWRWVASNGTWALQAVNDAYSAAANALTITRSGITPVTANFLTTNLQHNSKFVLAGDESVQSRHLAPVVIMDTCSTTTLIDSGTQTDITGCSRGVTPSIASTALIWATADFQGGTADELFALYIDVDDVDQATGVYRVAVNADRQQVTTFALVNLTAAAHTIKLQAARLTGTGSTNVINTQTRQLLMLIGDANATVS